MLWPSGAPLNVFVKRFSNVLQCPKTYRAGGCYLTVNKDNKWQRTAKENVSGTPRICGRSNQPESKVSKAILRSNFKTRQRHD